MPYCKMFNPFPPGALLRLVKSSGVRQSEITKCPLLSALGGKELMCVLRNFCNKKIAFNESHVLALLYNYIERTVML